MQPLASSITQRLLRQSILVLKTLPNNYCKFMTRLTAETILRSDGQGVNHEKVFDHKKKTCATAASEGKSSEEEYKMSKRSNALAERLEKGASALEAFANELSEAE